MELFREWIFALGLLVDSILQAFGSQSSFEAFENLSHDLHTINVMQFFGNADLPIFVMGGLLFLPLISRYFFVLNLGTLLMPTFVASSYFSMSIFPVLIHNFIPKQALYVAVYPLSFSQYTNLLGIPLLDFSRADFSTRKLINYAVREQKTREVLTNFKRGR